MGEQEIRQLISDFKSVSGELGGLEVYYELYLDDPEKMNFFEVHGSGIRSASICGIGSSQSAAAVCIHKWVGNVSENAGKAESV
ncbi:MAG: hypothetical protein ACLRPV_06400 [Lacrimispora saccharolytica]